MVGLWISRPLDFSAFPTVLLIATLLRLSLNVATTRLILSNGHTGYNAAGHVIGGFSNFVMAGDFVIGVIVFVILVTVNFLVITKGSTRIAEVGARFTLDAIPGKQMAIDADLSAGLIDEQEARARRLELEQESSFFGSMDGASKFVRGDAIAGLIITAVNVFGGIIIGVTRHGMTSRDAADVFTKLSVGDGLVSQIPALIVSLAAGLLVSKGGNKGSAQEAIVRQLSAYPNALLVAAGLLSVMALAARPAVPAVCHAFGPARQRRLHHPAGRLDGMRRAQRQRTRQSQGMRDADEKNSVKDLLRTAEIELCLGKQLVHHHACLAGRTGASRRQDAAQVRAAVWLRRAGDHVSATISRCRPRPTASRSTARRSPRFELRIGDVLVIPGDKPRPELPGDEAREPAFGMPALWVQEIFASELRRNGHVPIDGMSVLLTHLSEVIRNNLSQLLSYKDMRLLIDRLEPEYKKLLDEICPAHISFSGLQAMLKLLLAERVSIRNLHLILEAVAEIAPHVRKPEAIVEHVRMRMAQQICGDLAQDGVLRVLRLGNRWDLAFHQALKRDNKGEVIEFDIDPRLIEQFAADVTKALKPPHGPAASASCWSRRRRRAPM